MASPSLQTSSTGSTTYSLPNQQLQDAAQTQQPSHAQSELYIPQTVPAQGVSSPREVAELPYPHAQQPSSELPQQVMQNAQLQQPPLQQQASHPLFDLSSTPSPRPQQTSPPPMYSQSPSASQIEHLLNRQQSVSGAQDVSRGSMEHQAITKPPMSSTPPISGHARPQSAALYDATNLASYRSLASSDGDANRHSLSPDLLRNNDPLNHYQGIQQQSHSGFSNHLWAQEITTNFSCKLCTHCRLGIPYYESYFRCLFCQLNVCNKCHGSHPQAHYQNLVKMVSQPSTPGAARSEKECSRCQKHVHCRYDCQECSFTLCDDCHNDSNDRHKHRSFISIEPPFRSLKISGAASSQHRCSHSTVSNCSRCQGPVDLRHSEYKCRTCLLNYDGSINLCETCYTESWPSHDESHELISIKIESVSNDSEGGLRCVECGNGFSSLDRTTLIRHVHRSYVFNIGPRAREMIVNEAFRLCQLKPFRTDQPQVLECARCKHEFPAQTMRICAGACEGTFCEHCFPLASVNHMHGPQNFRSLTDKPRPEIGFLPAGWRAMDNKEGRTYYIQDLTNAFTFNKPAIPDVLPAGWVKTVDPLGKTMYLHHQTNTSSYVSPVYGIAPAGWELKQTDTGRLFYVNRQTQVTSWHKPHFEPLPPGWEAGQHSDGRVFYINHVTKTNTWIKPTLPAIASVKPAPSQAMTPIVAMARPVGGLNRPVSVMVNHSGFIASPVVSGVRPQALPINSTILPLRTTSSVSNPTIQHMRSMQPQPGFVGVTPRPSLTQQTTSSPAISTQTNMTSSVGSLTNSVVNNPQAMKAAVSLGKFAIKTAMASDSGDSSSVDGGFLDFGDSSSYQVQVTNGAPNDINPSTLTNMSSNSHSGILMTQPNIEATTSSFSTAGPEASGGDVMRNEHIMTSSSALPSQRPLVGNQNYSNAINAPTINTNLGNDTTAISYTSNQPWMSGSTSSMIDNNNQDTATYSAYSSSSLNVIENTDVPYSTSTVAIGYQDMNAGQTQVYSGTFGTTYDASTDISSIQDYNTYQVQAQESDVSFTVDSTTAQDFSDYDCISTGAVDETSATADDSYTVVESSFDCDFSTQDAGLF